MPSSVRILVTRPDAQSGPLIEAIQAQGDVAIALPLLKITPIAVEAANAESQAIINRIVNLAQYQHVIYISTNAVKCAWSWIDQYWPQLPAQQTWYAIGQATAAQISALDVPVEQAGVAMNSESLLAHPQLQVLDNQKVLIMRGQGGREYLKKALEARGAAVDYCEVYQRQPILHKSGTLLNIINKGIDFLTLSSAETIQQLLDQAMMDKILEEVLQIPLIVPGKRLNKAAVDKGFVHVFPAENAGLQAMLNVVKKLKKTTKKSLRR